MTTLTDELLYFVAQNPGKTDREITDALRGCKAAQQPVNQAARLLESKGLMSRRKRSEDGLIGNYIGNSTKSLSTQFVSPKKNHDVDALSEEELKTKFSDWLQSEGWVTEVAWGRTPGIDIDARRKGKRWIIEVKGPGSRSPMRVNYFIGIFGETLQRMDDTSAKYSIALPDLKQYRGLWQRLPDLAKKRTGISLLLMSMSGKIEELR